MDTVSIGSKIRCFRVYPKQRYCLSRIWFEMTRHVTKTRCLLSTSRGRHEHSNSEVQDSKTDIPHHLKCYNCAGFDDASYNCSTLQVYNPTEETWNSRFFIIGTFRSSFKMSPRVHQKPKIKSPRVQEPKGPRAHASCSYTNLQVTLKMTCTWYIT
jgi:hypothetical protein